MLGGMEPNNDSGGGPEGVGEAAPDWDATIASSNVDPAGPGVGWRPSRIALATSAAFHFE